MVQRSSRFLRNLFCSLGHVLLDLGGILGLLAMAALCTGVVICVCLFFQIGYELMFDPNATDVAARLASVSISPERWM
jgi:hypothetical protein